MKDNGLGKPKSYYCGPDGYPSHSSIDHRLDRYVINSSTRNPEGETTYRIQDRMTGDMLGGDYHNQDLCMQDIKLLNGMDDVIHSFEMLLDETLFVHESHKVLEPDTDYGVKLYKFRELLEEQNKKIKNQRFMIRWQEQELSNLKTINNELNAENEALELLLEHRTNDLSDERYRYVEGKDIYIHDTLIGQRFYQSDLDYLTSLLNNYSLAIRKILDTKG